MTRQVERPELFSSALLDVRVWFERAPWRISGGWSLVAALLAVDVLAAANENLALLLLLFLLVDPLWGSIWGALTLPGSLPRITQVVQRSRFWLPYLHSGSPAARLFGKDAPGFLPVLSRVALPGVALSLLVAAVLGSSFVALTALVVVFSVGGWLHRQIGLVPVVLLHALVAVTLPWLAAFLMGETLGYEIGHLPFLLALLWTLHHWAGVRSLHDQQDRVGLVALGTAQIGIAILLIWAQMPLWVAFLTVLWLPTWLMVYQGHSLRRIEIWWLAAMLVSGIALGSSGS